MEEAKASEGRGKKGEEKNKESSDGWEKPLMGVGDRKDSLPAEPPQTP